MLPIPRRHAHFVFGVLQSGLTTCVATLIASLPLFGKGGFLANWLISWGEAWALLLPIVIFFAPVLRRLAEMLTRA